MSLAGLLVDDITVPADLHGLTTVVLVERDGLEAAVAVPVVLPVDERRAASLLVV